MCVIRLREKEVLSELPEEFPCWKALRRDDSTEFADPQEEKLKRGRTFTAENRPFERADIDYPPGFHAFIDRDEAISYRGYKHHLSIVKFHAKKRDVIAAGHHSGRRCVVLSRITRK